MKRLITLSGFAFLSINAITAQPAQADGEAQGQITLADNSVQSGTIKDNIRKKGELTITVDGKKTKFKAGDIAAAKVGGTQYITRNYTFYEVIWEGSNLCLLRKASEPSGLQYNGSEAVVISSEGKVDDYFIKKNANNSLQLLTKKNAAETFKSICPTCSASINADTFDLNNIKTALAACDACK